MEVPEQSSSGTAALDCRLLGERTYPSFNQLFYHLFLAGPAWPILTGIRSHTGISTYIKDVYVVKQT